MDNSFFLLFESIEPKFSSCNDWTTKYNSDGDKQWSKQFSTGSTKREEGEGIAVDGSGNVYITGYTSGELSGNTNLGSNDVFILKYDTNGNLQ